MKSKIKSYKSDHIAITEDGDIVQVAVNVPHPKAGETLDHEKSQIIGKVEKAPEEPKKEEPKK